MPVNSLKITRLWIERNCHGKWDLVETILSKEKLLQHTTKALSWELQALLEITPEEFPAASFYKWIQRYRKKHTMQLTFENKEKGKYGKAEDEENGNSVTGKGNTGGEKKRNNNGWKNFQPTDPSTLKKETEAVLVKVLPDKNHGS